MKKTILYTLFLVLFILIVVGIKKTTRTSTLRIDKTNFFIADTSSIIKVVIENRNLDKILLERDAKRKQWQLNDSIKANQYSINLLLKTIKEMRVKTPIARSALENVIKRMAVQHTKVEFFNRKDKIKTIYIGGETMDQLGTFMMIEGATEPYIVHIPGFNGYLSSRFSCQETTWKSKQIFHNIITEANYFLYNDTIHEIEIEKKHLKHFSKINCERYIQNIDNLEEIKQRHPFITFYITTNRGEKQSFYCIRKKPVNKAKYANQKYDQERFYGLINGTLMLIQYKQLQDLIYSEEITGHFLPWQNNLIE